MTTVEDKTKCKEIVLTGWPGNMRKIADDVIKEIGGLDINETLVVKKHHNYNGLRVFDEYLGIEITHGDLGRRIYKKIVDEKNLTYTIQRLE